MLTKLATQKRKVEVVYFAKTVALALIKFKAFYSWGQPKAFISLKYILLFHFPFVIVLFFVNKSFWSLEELTLCKALNAKWQLKFESLRLMAFLFWPHFFVFFIPSARQDIRFYCQQWHVCMCLYLCMCVCVSLIVLCFPCAADAKSQLTRPSTGCGTSTKADCSLLCD